MSEETEATLDEGTGEDIKDVLYPEEGKASAETKPEGDEPEKTEDTGEETGEGSEDKGLKDDEPEETEEGGEDADEGETGLVTVEDLEFSEGAQVNEVIQNKFLELINNKDLTPKEIAQGAVDLQKELFADQVETHNAQVNKWAEEVKADKELGGDNLKETLGMAAKARDEFGSKELSQLLDETGLGNHPEVVKFFYNVGRGISDDSYIKGSASVEEVAKTPAQILYGQTK